MSYFEQNVSKMILPKKDVSYVAAYMIKFTGFNKFDQVNLAVENSFLTVK